MWSTPVEFPSGLFDGADSELQNVWYSNFAELIMWQSESSWLGIRNRFSDSPWNNISLHFIRSKLF